MWKSISVRILRYLASGDLNLNWGSAFEDRETSVLFCFRRDVVPVYLRGAKMEREGEMEHGRHFPLWWSIYFWTGKIVLVVGEA